MADEQGNRDRLEERLVELMCRMEAIEEENKRLREQANHGRGLRTSAYCRHVERDGAFAVMVCGHKLAPGKTRSEKTAATKLPDVETCRVIMDAIDTAIEFAFSIRDPRP